jgi:hypothetical protein
MSAWTVDGAKDLAVRAVKTAVQTFIGVVGANVAGWTDLDALQSAGIAAAAAGASVIINAILTWSQSR